MLDKKYDSLVTELTSYFLKYSELSEIQKNAELDLKWRLTELYGEVVKEDEQKFINISGMQGHLVTTEEKLEIMSRQDDVKNLDYDTISDMIEIEKKTSSAPWAKSLYRRAVKRCHPDIIKINDLSYREEMIQLYKAITESYENDNLDILMIETFKLFIKPERVTNEQIEILEISKQDHHKKIKNILSSQGYMWSTFSNELKENFLINLMKQHGVRFVDRSKVKEVLSRKVSNRKMGQRPKNKLRERVKNKK